MHRAPRLPSNLKDPPHHGVVLFLNPHVKTHQPQPHTARRRTFAPPSANLPARSHTLPIHNPLRRLANYSRWLVDYWALF